MYNFPNVLCTLNVIAKCEVVFCRCTTDFVLFVVSLPHNPGEWRASCNLGAEPTLSFVSTLETPSWELTRTNKFYVNYVCEFDVGVFLAISILNAVILFLSRISIFPTLYVVNLMNFYYINFVL